MDPMRYLREKAEGRAFARQGKELPKGMMGMFNDNVDDPKISDETAGKMDEWDALDDRGRYEWVTQNGVRYAPEYFDGQNVQATRKAVLAKWDEKTKGKR